MPELLCAYCKLPFIAGEVRARLDQRGGPPVYMHLPCEVLYENKGLVYVAEEKS